MAPSYSFPVRHESGSGIKTAYEMAMRRLIGYYEASVTELGI